jgi:hypothetical protein
MQQTRYFNMKELIILTEITKWVCSIENKRIYSSFQYFIENEVEKPFLGSDEWLKHGIDRLSRIYAKITYYCDFEEITRNEIIETVRAIRKEYTGCKTLSDKTIWIL